MSSREMLIHEDSDFMLKFSCRMMGSNNREVNITHEVNLPDHSTHQDVADQMKVFLQAMQFQLDDLVVKVDDVPWKQDDTSINSGDTNDLD